MTDPVTLKLHPKLAVRARWIHPSRDRLVFLGQHLYVAGPTGDFRREGGRKNPDAAALWARQNGFKLVGGFHNDFSSTSAAVPTEGTARPRKTNKTALNNPERSAIQENVGVTRRVYESNVGIYLERVRVAVPVSSLLDEPGGAVAYLRRLALHRRRVRKAGWLGPMKDTTPIATREEHRLLKRRQEKNNRLKKSIIKRARKSRLQTA